jgi:hypothetical protein
MLAQIAKAHSRLHKTASANKKEMAMAYAMA